MVSFYTLIVARQSKLTPDGEDGLKNKVKGDPVEDSSDTHRLDEVETAKDDLWAVSARPPKSKTNDQPSR